MDTYADTSFLVSLYAQDAFSGRANVWLATNPVALPLTEFGRTELLNALARLAFTGALTAAQHVGARGLLESDLGQGRLRMIALAWPAVFTRAEQLTGSHTVRLGTRTLDILHVASAQVMGATKFVSFDSRQAVPRPGGGARVASAVSMSACAPHLFLTTVNTEKKAAALKKKPEARLRTAADFGGKRPPVTTATRWSDRGRDEIADYARTHTNEQTKHWFGCSAHFVGRLRKERGLPFVGVATAGFRTDGEDRGAGGKYIRKTELAVDVSPEIPGAALEAKVRYLMKTEFGAMPEGVVSPTKITVTSEESKRDPRVKAWVRKQAKGRCELCKKPAPFSDDESPFLEVHHVKFLSADGSDRPTNAVALCPNCHRRCHCLTECAKAKKELYRRVARLIGE